MARTHYDNLKVTQTASGEAIKRAYKVLVQKWHPDRNTHRLEVAENNIKIINEAYRVLSSPELRRDHDEWIHRQKNEHAAESTGTYDASRKYDTNGKYDNDRRSYGPDGIQSRRKRKRTRTAGQSFRVSKKKFILFLSALIGIPATVGTIYLNMDTISGLVTKVPVVGSRKPDSVAVSANGDAEIEKAFSEFFTTTNRTLSFIRDRDSAIAAVPELKQARSLIDKVAAQLENTDSEVKTSASKAAADGLRDLEPLIYRLQENSDIWSVLYPTLNPMTLALRRISGVE